MNIRIRVAALIAACLILAGCASQPVIPFDKASAGEIKTVGIITPYMGERPSVWLASSPGQSFGLIGALVDAGLQSSRESDFWKEIDGDNHPPRAEFDLNLKEALEAAGYAVKPVYVKDRSSSFLKAYPAGEGVDAFIDVTFLGMGYGYVAAGIGDSTPYRPFGYVNVRMVRASDNAVLMQDMIFYNYIGLAGQKAEGVTLAPDPAYTFVDFDAMKADPPTATKGLHDALKQVAGAIAAQSH